MSGAGLMDRIDQLRNFVTASPDDPFPRYALALELKGKGDAAQAADELQRLIARSPDYLAAYLQLGMLHAAAGKTSEARSVLVAGQGVARKQGNSHTLSELTTALEGLS
jgi:thioredoxin-like negative regulator of GroEL